MSLTAVRSRPGATAPTPLGATARSRASRLDWWLLTSISVLIVIGCIAIYSATSGRVEITGDDPLSYMRKHLVNIVLGAGLLVAVAGMDYRWIRFCTPLLYLGAIFGLGLVLAIGSTINGSRSWLVLGGFSFQPSEFAKLAVVLTMALLVADRAAKPWVSRVTWQVCLGLLAIPALPIGLILLQPDLGTGLVLSATVFGVLAVIGVSWRWLTGLVAAGIAAVVLAVTTGLLKGYQIDRLLAFTNPDLDPRGAGYNTEQARIAVGNGGLFGQGLFDGSQTQSGFVPEQHTDFIFTAIAEESGLLGAVVVVALLGVVVWRALVTSRTAQDSFGRIAAAGIACWFALQGFQNVGMCLGIVPVTGVPLPFVSYGGTSLFASMMAVGVLLSIQAKQTGAVRSYRLR